MALPTVIQGAQSPSLQLTWYQNGTTTPVDLTGATITALIKRGTTVEEATGTFTLVDAANGVFRWDFSETDVATAGTHTVQFDAAFGSEPSPAKTFKTGWTVAAALVESA